MARGLDSIGQSARLRTMTPKAGTTGPQTPKSGALALGIDLGGTKIEIIALDDRGEVLLRRRRRSPRGDYRKTPQIYRMK